MIELVSISELRALCRPISYLLDEFDVASYIATAQNIDIKPKIGDSLFIDIKNWFGSDDKQPFDDYSTLFFGGVWSDSCGIEHECTGLQTALAYYVWARMAFGTNDMMNRSGLMEKPDAYSASVAYQQRKVQENDARRTADIYLSECIFYLRANCNTFSKFKHARLRNNINFRVIGD